MNEHQAEAFYFVAGLVVALIASMISVFVLKKEDASNVEALLMASVVGGFAGALWPIVIASLVAGSVGFGVWALWDSFPRKSA